jgi:hypothetical protein
LSACAPSFVDEPWLVTAPRILAITAEPPEVAPGGTATLTAIVSGEGSPGWSRCDVPRPLAQNESVAVECLASARAAPAGALTFTLAVPAEACARFGPEVASAGDRPRDADASGGWYQPVGASLEGALVFAFERLSCAPANVSAARAPNHNPVVSLEARVDGAQVELGELPMEQEVELVPTLDAPEPYVLIDPSTLALSASVETQETSWFVTAGTLSRASTRAAPTSWHAPGEPGTGMLWVVARDSRGGIGLLVRTLAWR